MRLTSVTHSHDRPRRQVSDLREWWELIFFCWRWFVVLIPATAQAIEIVLALAEGRTPTFVIDVLR
jgi:hypothetical protein